VIVLSSAADSRLTEAERERLWAAFRVPVFEQVISERGILLATDCEAHGGLHVESPKFAADDDQLDRSACACGRKTPRLANPATKIEATGGMRDHQLSTAGGGSIWRSRGRSV
jgi:hypothetical protein